MANSKYNSTYISSEITDYLQATANWLVRGKLLDDDLAQRAVTNAASQAKPLIRYVVEQSILRDADIADRASRQFGLPLLDLDAIDPVSLPLAVIDPKLIKKHRILPLAHQDSRVFLGLSDPANSSALDEIKFHTGCSIELVVVEDAKLERVIHDLLEAPDVLHGPGEGNTLDFTLLEPEAGADTRDGSPLDQATATIDETPVMRFVNKLLMDAIRHGISDIHIECYEKNARIRFREDGRLREIARPSLAVARKMSARLKVMARLNIAEKRLPQDGRFKLSLSAAPAIDFRVSTLPTLWGEKTVLRLLDRHKQPLDLDGLGFKGEQKRHFVDALYREQGLILVTGPTGSGKSSSLYAGLQLLNTRERNIATAEDPVEIPIEGINQVAVNPAAGLDFAQALRAFLRQDPDVLMVGEIRDPETAEIAIRAAQTGHLVMSTLHTNSAPETLSRLMDMGIPAYHIATSVSLVIAQRLARRLCNRCKKPLKLPRDVLVREGFEPPQLDYIQLFSPTGCDLCHTGYKGRVGVYETVPITHAISHVIMNNGNSMQIADIASKDGFNTLRISALEMAAKGLTSLEEVNRISRTRP